MMKPYFEEEAGQIYLGDCREVLPDLPQVDLVLTDPPYGISQDCNLSKSGIERYGSVDFGDWDKYFPIDIVRTLPVAGSYYIFCPYQSLGDLAKWATEYGLLQRVLWWKKSNPTRRNGDVYWSIPGEHCFYAKRSGATFNASHQVGYFETANVNGEHPTQKPLSLISRLCTASSNHGDTILDPFLGSGTTAVAAKKLGRKYIGIEIEEKYCAIAVKRLSQSVMDLNVN